MYRGKFVAPQAFIRKEERAHMNNLIAQPCKLKKALQRDSKTGCRPEIKHRAEMNELECTTPNLKDQQTRELVL